MKLECTEKALQALEEKGFRPEERVLYISHETDGTGCVVNGVSDLVSLKKENLPETGIFLETLPREYSAALDKRVDWIYDDHLIVDFNTTAGMFQLKSPNQILNPRMTFRELETKV